MIKADLLKLLEPLSDTDIIHCQVNYTTSKTNDAYSQYNHTTEVTPITGLNMQKFPKGSNRNNKVAYLQVNLQID